MKALTTLFVLFFAAIVIHAQVPAAFNYQGVARDLSNNPITDQEIGLRISILEESESGTVIYQETHHPTTNKIGLFNVALGLGNASTGSLEQIDWGNAEHFVQIEIDEQGGTNYQIVGTSQLLAVPYAMHAANGSKWREEADGSITRDSRILVNEDSDTIGTSLNTAIAIFNRPYKDGGVGLGIFGYPDTDLVYPHLRRSVMLYASGDATDMVLCATDHNGTIRFMTGRWYDPSNERMRIDPNGDVGIGTTNPASKIHVNDGDIFIEDSNRGVIMKSPNGSCWRMTVSNTGQPVFNSVSCPN